MERIKNIPHKQIVELAKQVDAKEGEIVSKTLTQNAAVSLTLFAFAKGEEIGTHSSYGDAMVTVLEGVGRFTVDGETYLCHTGETLVMPANIPHSVFAQETFKMLLTVIFPIEE